MTDITVQVKGDKQLLKKMLNRAVIDGELLEAVDKAGVVVTKRLQTYPPARPSSTYDRTGTLGRKWQVRSFVKRPSSFVSEVTNPVSYAPYVQAADSQAWMHAGRWPTDRQVLKEQGRKIRGFFEAALRNIRRYLER